MWVKKIHFVKKKSNQTKPIVDANFCDDIQKNPVEQNKHNCHNA